MQNKYPAKQILADPDYLLRERVDNESKPTFTQLNLNRYHRKIVSNLYNYFTDEVMQAFG